MSSRLGRQVSNGGGEGLAFQPPSRKVATTIHPAFTWELVLGWAPNLCALVRPRRPLFSGLSWSLEAPIQRERAWDSKGVVDPAILSTP
jgi:hypothetical protein